MKNFDLNSLDGSLDHVEVQVTVPKFKIHFSLNMKDTLQKVSIYMIVKGYIVNNLGKCYFYI